MIENEPNICIADKASNLAEMFVLAYLFRNNFASRENLPLTYFGAIKIGRNMSTNFNFTLSGPIFAKFCIMT